MGFLIISGSTYYTYLQIKKRNKRGVIFAFLANIGAIAGYSYVMDMYITNKYKPFLNHIKNDKQISFYLDEMDRSNVLKKKNKT